MSNLFNRKGTFDFPPEGPKNLSAVAAAYCVMKIEVYVHDKKKKGFFAQPRPHASAAVAQSAMLK